MSDSSYYFTNRGHYIESNHSISNHVIEATPSVNKKIPRSGGLLKTRPVQRGKGQSSNAVNERNMKNDLAFQDAFILTLLNTFFSFKIRHPVKENPKTHPRPVVESFYYNEETIEVGEIIQQKAEKLIAELQHSTGKGQRKCAVGHCRSLMMSNYLIDSLRLAGFFIESKTGTRYRSSRYEIINNIYWEGKLVFTKSDITKFGLPLNNYFLNLTNIALKKGLREVFVEQNSISLNIFVHDVLPDLLPRLYFLDKIPFPL